jgi:EmrB/QacA subfamily drug resistance transporter
MTGAVPPPVPHRRAITAACMMAQFMAAVEATIVGAAAPTISGDLGNFGLFSWVFGSYLLAQAASTPIYGKLADVYGRKRVFMLGGSLFLVASLACGLAWGMVPLIAFRFLQGLGAGAVQPIAWTIMADIYPPAERARMQGWLSGVWATSAVGGPVLGAFLVLHFHWSAIFFINLPIGIAAIALLRAYLTERRGEMAQRIDWAGATLLVAAVAPLMAVLGQAHDMSTPVVWTLLVVGVVCSVALVWQQARAASPIIPHMVWHRRVLVIGNAATLLVGMFIIINTLFLPSFIQVSMGRGVAFAGLAIGASSVAWTSATVVAGRLMVRTSYRLTAVLGSAIASAVALLLSALRPDSAPVLAIIGAFGLGFGMGFVNTTFVVCVQTAVGWGLRGAVTGANMFMRVFGQSLGAGLFGAVFNWWLAAAGPDAEEQVSRLLAPGGRATIPPAQQAALGNAIGHGMHDIYLVALALALVITALAAFLPAELSPNSGRAVAEAD